jgi:hypothetical protein
VRVVHVVLRVSCVSFTRVVACAASRVARVVRMRCRAPFSCVARLVARCPRVRLNHSLIITLINIYYTNIPIRLNI